MNCLGGNDTVIDRNIAPGNGITHNISLDMGDGNDVFRNDTTGNIALNLRSAITVVGGAGDDAIFLDDSVDPHPPANYFTFDNYPAGGYAVREGASGFAVYNADIEHVTVLLGGSPSSDIPISLLHKPTTTTLYVAGAAANDLFTVGSGDLDSDGFAGSNTTVVGGGGQDQITFDDHRDDHDPADSDTFTFFVPQVQKDSAIINLSGFESQRLITSGVNTSGISAPNTVRIIAANIPTVVETSAGSRDTMVEVGATSGGLATITAPIGVSNFGPQTGQLTVSVFDQNVTTPRTWQVSASSGHTFLTGPISLDAASINALYVYGGTGNDAFNVNGTTATCSVFLNAGAGDDTFALGSTGGNFTDLAGRVFANGEAGNGDVLNLTNGTLGGVTNGVLTSGSFQANGGPNHLYSQVERVDVFVNDAGSNINVTSAGSAVIHGANGADSVTVGGGDLNDNIAGSVNVMGAGGSDSILIDDVNDVAPAGVSISYKFDIVSNLERFLKTTGTIVQGVICTDVEQRQFDASNEANVINVIDSNSALRINSNGGNDQIVVTDALNGVTVNTGAGSDLLTVNSDSGSAGDGPLLVVVDQNDDVNNLDVRAGGTLRITSGAVLEKTSNAGSTFNLTGTLDVAGGALLFKSGGGNPTSSTTRTLIMRGFAAGAWSGTNAAGAINSSLAATSTLAIDALGYALGSEIPLTAIGPYSIAPADVVVRYTSYGDTDLNGVVDFDDYSRTDAGFNTHRTGWVNGDFDYNNVVDFDDYSLIYNAFNTQGARRQRRDNRA